MTDYTTVSLRKEFVADVEEYIEDEPFGSVKEFVKHVVVQEMESEDEISEAEARRIGKRLQDLGYVD